MSVFHTRHLYKTQSKNLTKKNIYSNETKTYIPSIQVGSFKSSVENKAFNSGEEINFRRGGDGTEEYFLPTGNITY